MSWQQNQYFRVLPNLDKIFTGCWAIFCDDTSQCSQYLGCVTTVSALQTSESVRAWCGATNCKMFPNNNFPVSLQVSKQSQQSVTNTDSDHDQIFKTRKYYISTFPCESVTPRAASDQWLNIIAIIVIHLCNLFPWLPPDSPHLLLICLWCPGVHWTIMPLPASIHRKCSFDTPASEKSLEVNYMNIFLLSTMSQD